MMLNDSTFKVPPCQTSMIDHPILLGPRHGVVVGITPTEVADHLHTKCEVTFDSLDWIDLLCVTFTGGSIGFFKHQCSPGGAYSEITLAGLDWKAAVSEVQSLNLPGDLRFEHYDEPR